MVVGGVTGLLTGGALPVDIFGPWSGFSTGLRPPANADRADGAAGVRLAARSGCCVFSLRLASSVFSHRFC